MSPWFVLLIALGTLLLFAAILFLTPLGNGVLLSLLSRPQNPKERPYQIKEVTFPGGEEDVTLAGEWTMPQGEGPFPAALLIAGSGPHNRNEEVANHKTLLVLSDFLTRQGFAVLRYDKRGIGQSNGDYSKATMDDFAKDAAAAMRWVKEQAQIDATRVGYIGHSTGGYVAPLAAQIEHGTYLVLLAGPGRHLSEEILEQNALVPRALGKSEDWIQQNVQLLEELISIYQSVENPEDVRQRAEACFAERQKELALPTNYLEASFETLPPAWWMWAMRHEPLPVLQAFEGPVLALYGDKDLQVSSEKNEPVVKGVLKHPSSKVLTLEGLNHLFQPAKTGSIAEYAWCKTTFDKGAMWTIVDWLNSLEK